MAKAKYSVELKMEIVKEYKAGRSSYKTLAKKYGVGKSAVKDWVMKYREQGEIGLRERHRNSAYSSEFKTKCVEAVLRREGSVDDVIAKYNISSRSVLRSWNAFVVKISA